MPTQNTNTDTVSHIYTSISESIHKKSHNSGLFYGSIKCRQFNNANNYIASVATINTHA